MVILLRKRDLVLSCLFCCFFLGLAAVLWRGSAVPAFHVRDEVPVTVVIDPGHGGEDGGAVSPGGVAESQINLAVSLRVSDLLRFTGLRTRLTRMEDVTICDQGLDTMHQRKTSDLKNRVKLVEETENAILLSIHQNSLPSSWGPGVLEPAGRGGSAGGKHSGRFEHRCQRRKRQASPANP